ncbi:MAG: hydantoinase/oxoprolinase family protein, partial [Myxococcota bacterium]
LVAVPMVKVETLGAGGGSICFTGKGGLEVGPQSAGADPGPVCYGRGGELPTVTDANLVLGLLSPDSEFAGGRFRLTRKGVDEAFRAHVADPLGYSVEEAAFDCWRLVNANMTQAVRRTTAGRGIDPSQLEMLAYGGNGPVFAGIQAQELGIERVRVPRACPAFSALGALAARPMIDEERAYLASADRVEASRLAALWGELAERAERFFKDAGFGPEELSMRYQLNLRYPGQNWSLTVDIEEGFGRPGDLGFVETGTAGRGVELFHALHEQEYGHRRDEEIPEITGVRLVTTAEVPRPAFGGGEVGSLRSASPIAQREANLGRGFEKVAVYRGPDLAPGDRVGAPGIIEETFTTIVVYPGWEAVLDESGDYLLRRAD